MPKVLPGAYNVFVPNARSSGNLFVDFSRNINDFACLKYCQPVPVQQAVGLWYQMGLDQRARLTDEDAARYLWADGTPRPKDQGNDDYFEEKSFRCERRSYSSVIGKMVSEQAAWDEIDRRSRMLAQQAMTVRTNAIVSKLIDSSQYPADHVADLADEDAIPGVVGDWAASTAARMAIRRSLNHIKNKITLATRAAVNSDDLMLVMSPDTAEQIAVSQEIVEMIKESIVGLQYLKASKNFPKDSYGLPPRLYNTEVIIEKTVKVTTQRGLVAQTAQYVLPAGTVVVAHKPNSLEGVEGGRSFSTCSIHIYRNDITTGAIHLETEPFPRSLRGTLSISTTTTSWRRGALAAIKRGIIAHRGDLLLFRMRRPDGTLIPDHGELLKRGNVGTPMFVHPSGISFSRFESFYGGDFDFISGTIKANPERAVHWMDAVVVNIRPGLGSRPGLRSVKASSVKASMESAAPVVASSSPQPSCPPPSILIRGWNFTSAMARWAVAGMPRRTQAQIEQRLAICQGCPHFHDNQCMKCGCACVEKNRLINKLALATEKCPIGKWD